MAEGLHQDPCCSILRLPVFTVLEYVSFSALYQQHLSAFPKLRLSLWKLCVDEIEKRVEAGFPLAEP
ncbi:hypothetical protein JZ751_005022 [Albula glossodonta]|uniref:Uncharacterized protein n=1 Tax=Albula glossodonta TaxID=121402 RepID=A0A8T2P4G9_9TELE|nr:hypothetical protein JZ751_005022 [Albula glossodonta]